MTWQQRPPPPSSAVGNVVCCPTSQRPGPSDQEGSLSPGAPPLGERARTDARVSAYSSPRSTATPRAEEPTSRGGPRRYDAPLPSRSVRGARGCQCSSACRGPASGAQPRVGTPRGPKLAPRRFFRLNDWWPARAAPGTGSVHPPLVLHSTDQLEGGVLREDAPSRERGGHRLLATRANERTEPPIFDPAPVPHERQPPRSRGPCAPPPPLSGCC